MRDLYVFGQKVPEDTLKELIEEFGEENLTTDFLETLYFYEYTDNL